MISFDAETNNKFGYSPSLSKIYTQITISLFNISVHRR